MHTIYDGQFCPVRGDCLGGADDWSHARIWGPAVVRGAITVLTSERKLGKTTLLASLLKECRCGGVLGGWPVAAAPAVVVTEETQQMWARRPPAAAYGPQVEFVFRPHHTPPTRNTWKEFVRFLSLKLAARHGMVVLDPLSACLPAGAESSPDNARAALEELRLLTNLGTAVLFLHHPKKGTGPDNPRGTGVLTAFADVVATLDRVTADPRDRRRVLRHESRFDPPGELYLELAADRSGYTAVPEPADAFTEAWPVLRGVIEDLPPGSTRHAVHDAWPADHPKPCVRTLLRYLDRAAADGLVVRAGRGRSHEPFLYSLPAAATA